MWNGETESSGTPTQDSDYTIVTPEIALEMAISQRDTLQGDLQRAQGELTRYKAQLLNAYTTLDNLVDDVDMSSYETSVDTDTLKELCQILNVDTSVEIKVKVEVEIDLLVPRGTTEYDITSDIDNYVSITVEAENDDISVEDFSVNV